MTDNYSADLEEVIRSRASVLAGSWPSGLTMFVHATRTGFNVSFGPVMDPKLSHYRSAVIGIINGIKEECEMLAQAKRRQPAAC